MKRRLALVILVALAVTAQSCRKPRKRVLTKEQQIHIQESIGAAMPSSAQAIGASLDGRITLLGVETDQKTVLPGKQLKVTWYWKAESSFEGDWMIFVHLEAPGKKRSTHDHHAVGELYPIRRWSAGEVITDKQTITIPKDFPRGKAHLYVGIFDQGAWRDRRENVRMKVENASDPAVHVDRAGRIRAATITLGGKKESPAAAKGREAVDARERRYTAYQPSDAPTLDGKLDEASWRLARSSSPFVQPHGKVLSPRRLTQARVLWDKDFLYVGLSCRDDDVWNDLTGRDATLWKQDVVEVYLDPGADGKDYVELQISPTGEIFDALFTSRRRPTWQEAAAALTMKGMVAKVDVKGSTNQRGDSVTDRSWSAEIAIPWTDIPGVKGPPEDGATWAVNFYRIDGASPTRSGFMSAWSPAGGDFHNTKGFGSLKFRARPQPAPRRVGPLKGPASPRADPYKGSGPRSVPAAMRLTVPGKAPVAPPSRKAAPTGTTR